MNELLLHSLLTGLAGTRARHYSHALLEIAERVFRLIAGLLMRSRLEKIFQISCVRLKFVVEGKLLPTRVDILIFLSKTVTSLSNKMKHRIYVSFV